MLDNKTVLEITEGAEALAEAHVLATARGHAVTVNALPHTGHGAKARLEMFWSGLVRGVTFQEEGCNVRLVGGRSIICMEPFADVLEKIKTR